MPVRVLVIEDNAANLELMSYLLRAYGYQPILAGDGVAGVEAARSVRPDVVICDIQLPRMDGFQVLEALKSDAATKAVPVVAVTAFAMVGDKERVMSAGFDGYIGKPIVPETFVLQIEQFLGTKAAARPPSVHSASVAGPRAESAHKGARVLVVDNAPANLELMSSLLVPIGFEVVTARDVESAIALARERLPDLIISDVHMPGKNGFDFLSAAKSDPALRRVPFLLASATSWDNSLDRHASRLGADLLLLRPLDPERLLGKVEELLASGKAGKEPRAGYDTGR